MEGKEVLTTREAAEFLSMHEKTLVRKARAGLIPAGRTGRAWRFSKRQLIAWLEEGGIKDSPQGRMPV